VCGCVWIGGCQCDCCILVVLRAWFVSVLWVFVDSCAGFRVDRVLRGFCVGLFCCLSVCWRVFTMLSMLGLGCHGCGGFVLEFKWLARLLASRLALCVVFFHIYACVDAGLCALRPACRKLAPFCSFIVVAFFCGFCFGSLCVVVCWMCGGCSWLVGGGGPTCRVLNWFLFLCEVTCSVLVLVFVESGVFVASALGFGLVFLACGARVRYEKVLCTCSCL